MAKKEFQKIMTGDPNFTFHLQYSADPTKAKALAMELMEKLKKKGKKSYNGIFESLVVMQDFTNQQ